MRFMPQAIIIHISRRRRGKRSLTKPLGKKHDNRLGIEIIYM
jgi:hypothetical protein